GIAPRIVGFHQVDNGKSVVILVFRVGFQCFQQGQGIDVIACLQIEFGGAYNGTLRVLVFRLSGQVKVIGQRLLSLFSAYQAFGAVKVHVVGELPLREIRQVIVEGSDTFFTVSFQVHGVGRLITDGILLAGGDADIRHRLAVSQESFGITLFHVNVPDGLDGFPSLGGGRVIGNHLFIDIQRRVVVPRVVLDQPQLHHRFRRAAAAGIPAQQEVELRGSLLDVALYQVGVSNLKLRVVRISRLREFSDEPLQGGDFARVLAP